MNKYNLDIFKDKDYDSFAHWWEGEKTGCPPMSSLPKIGVVSGKMLAAGFLANTDTDIGIITWWHANPKNSPRDSYEALRKVAMGLMEAATVIGKTKVFCYTNNRGMIRLLESLGFKNCDGHLIAEVH